MTYDIVIVVSVCIDNVLKMVAPTETCKGWKIIKHNIYQSHWTALIIFYTIASVTDQDEPSQIHLLGYSETLYGSGVAGLCACVWERGGGQSDAIAPGGTVQGAEKRIFLYTFSLSVTTQLYSDRSQIWFYFTLHVSALRPSSGYTCKHNMSLMNLHGFIIQYVKC
jgi:hypothetical protein